MNVNTGEIRAIEDLTPEERASGEWVEIPYGAMPVVNKPAHQGAREKARRVRQREVRS